MGKQWKQCQPLFLWGSKITADGDCCHEIKRRLLFGRKVMTNLDSLLKSRDITVPTKVRLVKTMFFSSSHVWMWELDYKEGWLLRNWCFWTVLLEKTLEGLLDWKEIQPVHPKGNQSWISFRRKYMTSLDNLLKIRDITLPTRVHLLKHMVFLVVMYGCESWTIKKAEPRRIDAFEL